MADSGDLLLLAGGLAAAEVSGLTNFVGGGDESGGGGGGGMFDLSGITGLLDSIQGANAAARDAQALVDAFLAGGGGGDTVITMPTLPGGNGIQMPEWWSNMQTPRDSGGGGGGGGGGGDGWYTTPPWMYYPDSPGGSSYTLNESENTFLRDTSTAIDAAFSGANDAYQGVKGVGEDAYNAANAANQVQVDIQNEGTTDINQFLQGRITGGAGETSILADAFGGPNKTINLPWGPKPANKKQKKKQRKRSTSSSGGGGGGGGAWYKGPDPLGLKGLTKPKPKPKKEKKKQKRKQTRAGVSTPNSFSVDSSTSLDSSTGFKPRDDLERRLKGMGVV